MIRNSRVLLGLTHRPGKLNNLPGSIISTHGSFFVTFYLDTAHFHFHVCANTMSLLSLSSSHARHIHMYDLCYIYVSSYLCHICISGKMCDGHVCDRKGATTNWVVTFRIFRKHNLMYISKLHIKNVSKLCDWIRQVILPRYFQRPFFVSHISPIRIWRSWCLVTRRLLRFSAGK
jgi:hypothetical protein